MLISRYSDKSNLYYLPATKPLDANSEIITVSGCVIVKLNSKDFSYQ